MVQASRACAARRERARAAIMRVPAEAGASAESKSIADDIVLCNQGADPDGTFRQTVALRSE
eukprot:4345831-Pleurochrysis_carterae.AAC.2